MSVLLVFRLNCEYSLGVCLLVHTFDEASLLNLTNMQSLDSLSLDNKNTRNTKHGEAPSLTKVLLAELMQ